MKDINNCSHRVISQEYRDHLNSDYFREVAQRIKYRDGCKCRLCGSEQNLEIHHFNGKGRFREAEHPETLMCLCRKCHATIHRYYDICDSIKEYYDNLAHQEAMRKGYY